MERPYDSYYVDLGGPVHVADFGGDGPPIVLVHGLGGSHVNWISVGPGLAEIGHVVAIDLVGFGKTPPEGRSTEVLDNRDLLVAFLREHVEGPAVLIGNSMGGFISLLVSAKHPDLVRAFVGVGSALPRRLTTKVDPKVAGLFAAYMIPGLGERLVEWRYSKSDPEEILRETMELCTVDASRIDDDVYEAHLEMARDRYEMPWGREAFVDAARSLVPLLARRRTVEKIIERIEAPGLIVQGEKDRLVPMRSAQRLAQLRADWSFEVFEDVGHVAQLEAPERFVEFVGGWIQGLEAGAAARERETIPSQT